MDEEGFTRLRSEMVAMQIRGRGISDPKVLEAFLKVQRHIFVPNEYRDLSYLDYPLPIGYQQTISQPYIVAFMTALLRPEKTKRVLEIGTGSGYQTAILSYLYRQVYSLEIVPELATQAQKVFRNDGFSNIKVKIGNGYEGWPECAPYDGIIVSCAPPTIPENLVDQLAEGGKMVIPVGTGLGQKLYLVEKHNGRISYTESLGVIFVPMVHGAANKT